MTLTFSGALVPRDVIEATFIEHAMEGKPEATRSVADRTVSNTWQGKFVLPRQGTWNVALRFETVGASGDSMLPGSGPNSAAPDALKRGRPPSLVGVGATLLT